MKKIVILLTLLFAFSSCKNEDKKPVVKIVELKPEIRFGYNIDDYKLIQDTIKSGESFGAILDRHHVEYPKINQIATSVTEIFDVKRYFN